MKQLNKKIIFILSCVLVLVFGVIVFVKAQNEKKIEVKLLWEKNLDANVKDIVINEEEKSPGVIERKIIVITDKGVKVLDEDGNVLWEKRGWMFVSKQGKYIGELEPIKNLEKRFNLFNTEGEVISTFLVTNYNRRGAIISDYDANILVYGATWDVPSWWPIKIIIYNKNGGIVKDFQEPFSSSTRIIISKNGKNYLFFSMTKETQERGYYFLSFLSQDGNELWRKEFKSNEGFTGFEISDTANLIAVSKLDELVLYNKEGNLIHSFKIEGDPNPMKFSKGDEKYLAISLFKKIVTIDTELKNIMWEKNITGEVLDMIGDSTIVFDYVSKKIFIFDRNSNEIWSDNIQLFGLMGAKGFTVDSSKFLIGAKTLRYYEIKQN